MQKPRFLCKNEPPGCRQDAANEKAPRDINSRSNWAKDNSTFKTRRVRLSDGEIGYDTLIVATGAAFGSPYMASSVRRMLTCVMPLPSW
jgi:hypothetical protein